MATARAGRATAARRARLGWCAAIAALGVLVAFVIPPGAAATTLRFQSVEQLARDADLVVWGRVTRVGTRMQRGPDGLRPEREAHVDVQEALLGQASGTLRIQLRGGSHRAGERRVHGEAELREGDEVVLFLTRAAGSLRVLGMSMGVLQVVRTPAGNLHLARHVDDAALVDAEGRALPELDERLTFPELRAAIARAQQAP